MHGTSASSPAPRESPSMSSRHVTHHSKRHSWNSPATPLSTAPAANTPSHTKEQQHDRHRDHPPSVSHHRTVRPQPPPRVPSGDSGRVDQDALGPIHDLDPA